MTDNLNKKSITPYQDINDVLSYILNGIKKIADRNLVGLYPLPHMAIALNFMQCKPR
jgi:hypothetical protein